MAFVVSKPATYEWPVTIESPIDGGVYKKETFNAVFNRLSQTRLQEISKELIDQKMTDIDVAREALVGWNGILDDDKNVVEYNPVIANQLLDIAGFASAVAQSFFDSVTGIKRKN